MKRGAILGAVAAALVTAVHAEAHVGLALSPDQIKAAYAQASEDWRSVPPLVRTAFVLAEDKDFWTRSAGRSTLTRTVTQIATKGGGSLGAVLAVGHTLDREQIVDRFVNGVFLGQSCYGVSDAAQAYFGKGVAELSLAETASLAALPISPLNAKRWPDRVLSRRNWIIDQLFEEGFVTTSDAAAAKATPLDFREPLGTCAQ